jgi:hypothetical protein
MDRFPLSGRWALELIARVVPPSAAGAVPLQSQQAIGGLLERMFMFTGASAPETLRRVTAAFTLLDAAFAKDPSATTVVIRGAWDRLDELQRRETGLFRNAWEADERDLEERFGTLFALFEMTYERFYRTLAGPYVVADAITRSGQSSSEFLDAEGRVGAQRLAKVEAERGLPLGLLSEGVDSHLRNAAAHHQYDVLDADRVRVWDQDPRSRQVTWGPQELTYWETRTAVYRLSNTAYVLLLGLSLFDIAHGRVMAMRFATAPPRRRRHRRDVIEASMQGAALLHGFSLLAVDEEARDTLHVKLQVLGRTEVDQELQIMSGGGAGPGAYYVQRVETRYSPLARQVLGLVQMCIDLHVAFTRLHVSVVDKDGATRLGELPLTDAHRELVLAGATWEAVLASVPDHTLAAMDIPVVLEFPARLMK